MDDIEDRYSSFKLTIRLSKKNTKDGSGNDRRCGKDRREKSTKKYFLRGGFERRSWKERRNYWYMTR